MLRFILADLRRLWPGAVAVVALIALAVGLGTAITLQERALRLGSARASEAFDLVIGAPGSETQLVLSTVFLQAAALPLMPGAVLQALEDDPRVDWVAPIGFGDFHAGYPVVGTTTQLIERSMKGLAEGHVFAAEGEAVIGAAVDLPLGEKIVPTHGQLEEGGHAHAEVAYQVAGRLNPTGTPWDRAILVPIQAVWHVHGLEAGHDHDADHDHADHEEAHGPDATAAVGAGEVGADHAHEQASGAEVAHDDREDHDHDAPGAEGHDHDGHDHDAALFDADAPLVEDWHGVEIPGLPAVLVKPVSIGDAYRLRQDYRADPRTVGVFPGEVLTGLYGMMGDARLVLSAVAMAAQLLVGAALLLVTVLHLGQRRRQIGALRAFGAPRLAIFGIVWGELFALILTGIALGLLLGLGAAQAMSQAFAARQGFPLPVEFAPEDLGGLLLLLAVAALMPLVPALIAWRAPPAAALRG